MTYVELPEYLDRLIIHQIDLVETSPGGIDTCIRGLLSFMPSGLKIGVVGVSVPNGQRHKLGEWQAIDFDGNTVHFLPVTSLDPADQRRLIPHSVKVFWGLITNFRKIPKPRIIQFHRADLAYLVRFLFRGSELLYSIHTQSGGLTSRNSDSMWKFLSKVHVSMERFLIRNAAWVLVFNPKYGAELMDHQANVMACPTWFNPNLVVQSEPRPRTVFWAGRLEHPKNPMLALEALRELAIRMPEENWTLNMAGVGTLGEALQKSISEQMELENLTLTLLGRLSPSEMSKQISLSSSFLMTSHAGYEGYPRVLVEALAGGLPSVVTEGCDTGGLIIDGKNGRVVSPNPSDIADALTEAEALSRSESKQSVHHLSAPNVVASIYEFTENRRKK